MEKAIFDTSVWVDFSKGTQSEATLLLEQYLSEHVNKILMTPTITKEFLMGLKTTSDFKKYELYLGRLLFCEDDWLTTSVAAAKLYLDLKKKGVTIRKSTDCLIAQIAIQNDALLVHNDRDFEQIAKHSNLKTFSS